MLKELIQSIKKSITENGMYLSQAQSPTVANIHSTKGGSN